MTTGTILGPQGGGGGQSSSQKYKGEEFKNAIICDISMQGYLHIITSSNLNLVLINNYI